MTHAATTFRVPGADDFSEFTRALFNSFNAAPEEDQHASRQIVFEPGRSLVAEDEGSIVGTASVFTRDLVVPGAIVPAAHVTMVSVAPTHRRQGIFSQLMYRQLADVRAAGEPLAVLWASESRLYGRFGYGMATLRACYQINSREVGAPAPAPGTLRVHAPTAVAGLLSRVYDEHLPHRPGWSRRDGRWWQFYLADPKSRRGGGTELRALVHHAPDGAPDGYALYRTAQKWEPTGFAGEVIVQEVVGGVDAYRSMWRFLLTLDLTASARLWYGALDEPLQEFVAEPRRLGPLVGDGMWCRIVDVPGALAARRYANPVDLVVAVEDPVFRENTGRWHLTGGPAYAACRPTDRPADLTLTIAELGGLYLGGRTPAALGIDVPPGIGTAFSWHRAPSALDGF